MRPTPLLLLLTLGFATACEPEDLGVPNDWGLDTMHFTDVVVNETTCGEGPLPFFVGWEVTANQHEVIPNVASVQLDFDDPAGGPAPLYPCRVTEGNDDPWLLECYEGINLVFMNGGLNGEVSSDVHGAFLDASSLRMDLRHQIIDCGDPPRCEPYIMDCVMEYSTFYEAD